MLYGSDHPDTHASANRWRHQESTSFSRHAAPREADGRNGSGDLANFLHTTRVEPPKSAGSSGKYIPVMVASHAHDSANGTDGLSGMGAQHDGPSNTPSTHGSLDVKCGPLLNYRRMEDKNWYGSVLIVTEGGGLADSPVVPELQLRFGRANLNQGSLVEGTAHSNGANGTSSESYGVINGVDYSNGQHEAVAPQEPANGTESNGTNGVGTGTGKATIPGTKLYSDPANTFWRFDLKVPMQEYELHCDYEIPGLSFEAGKKTDKQSFFVPANSQSMRIMFHSCNGFSIGTDEEAWSGAALWNDVIRVHERAPFHVM